MSLDYRNIEITEEIFNSQEYKEYMKERLKNFWNCGIYYIINTSNNHWYIGSSKNINKRLSQHRSDLRANRHFNAHLQRARNKYGEESFIFNIIERLSYPEDRIERENKNIYLYKPEYNNILVNEDRKFILSDESRKKMSIAKKGKPSWNKGIKLPSLTDERKRQQSESLIGRKKGPMSDKQKSDISNTLRGRRITQEQYKKLLLYRKEKSGANHVMARKVYQYDLNGNFIREWNYMRETKEIGVDPVQVSACVNGKHKTAFGYRWYLEFKGNKIEDMILSRQQKNAMKKYLLTLS